MNEYISDDELRETWRKYGGKFHGPKVETGTMPESKLLPFLRDLIARAEPLSTDVQFPAMWPDGSLLTAEERVARGMPAVFLTDREKAESGECQVPPDGWKCTRKPGHDGPCAAWPSRELHLEHTMNACSWLHHVKALTTSECAELVGVTREQWLAWAKGEEPATKKQMALIYKKADT